MLPQGTFTVGPVTVFVSESDNEPSGLRPTTNFLDQIMGEHECVLNPAEVKKVAAAHGLSPVVVAFFVLGWVFAKLLLGRADDRFSSVVDAETFFHAYLSVKERREASELLKELVSLELANAMLLRLQGAPAMEDEFIVLRQRALKRFKVEVEEIVPGRYPRMLDGWGDKTRQVLAAVLPYFREHVRRI